MCPVRICRIDRRSFERFLTQAPVVARRALFDLNSSAVSMELSKPMLEELTRAAEYISETTPKSVDSIAFLDIDVFAKRYIDSERLKGGQNETSEDISNCSGSVQIKAKSRAGLLHKCLFH